ncbi:protein BOI2 [Podospora aff. communis PSN243]|uniref:Protein BOI2 n=1 Tax=Podospora aff. communis PSN243 TaxID=3040156 RepID=A0AAV9GLP7_9PEZI|nr:protein BOI2 [Podospora aff. communis PSN243]
MAATNAKPEVGDILVVIHDFQARSSDELSLAKGDRVELIERDDEFGDGWFLGKHLVNGNSGLFPEVYTRPAPRPIATTPKKPQSLAPLAEVANEQNQSATTSPIESKPIQIPDLQSNPVTLPLSSFKTTTATANPTPPSSYSSSLPSIPASGGFGRLNSSTDSHVLHETLNVIDEHMTEMGSPHGNGAMRNATDSGSEYSSHIDHRISYIQGEETDEEEEGTHSRIEVESWSADQVAEYLFTAGVEKHHCEVFRDQEITGEVLLGMDQTSLFIKAFDLGSVGRRLKTWQKIKSLQDDVNGQGGRRTTQSYGSEAGSDVKGRSRTNTMTSGSRGFTPTESRTLSLQTKRLSQTPKLEPAMPVSPISPLIDSPTRTFHEKRPSAASIRDLHHSRRHSSTDFRPSASSLASTAPTPKILGGSFVQQPEAEQVVHKKQPSFDRGWTLGSATAFMQRPQSSAGIQDGTATSEQGLQDSAVDLERGYFSGTDADSRRRNVLRKRDSGGVGPTSPKTSYADEQRVRSATALSRHSRFGSVDSARDRDSISPAAQRYYGVGGTRRSASNATVESIRPAVTAKDNPAPTVTKLDGSPEQAKSSPRSSSAMKRLSQVNHPDFNVGMVLRSGLGMRAASENVTGQDRSKLVASPIDSPLKDSPIYSPSRTGSSTPSVGPSFELDSPDAAKSPSTATTAASRGSRKKTKKETSAYTRGLQKITPREAMMDADYSGWMKKRSANLMTTWKPRLFVLKGRRLAYYYSEDDDQERGLIDISFHRVLPADNERLTGLHATLTGAGNSPAVPAGSHVPTLAATEAERDPIKEDDSIFIFKLVPPRAGLSRAVNFTKPTVHYFAVPNIKQGRLWMAALMKATIDRDDTQVITTTYQQKTISLAKARQMRHRPPALMNLDETVDDNAGDENRGAQKKDAGGLGIVYGEADSGVSGLEKFGLQGLPQVESARSRGFSFAREKDISLPQSA